MLVARLSWSRRSVATWNCTQSPCRSVNSPHWSLSPNGTCRHDTRSVHTHNSTQPSTSHYLLELNTELRLHLSCRIWTFHWLLQTVCQTHLDLRVVSGAVADAARQRVVLRHARQPSALQRLQHLPAHDLRAHVLEHHRPARQLRDVARHLLALPHAHTHS